MKQAYNDTDNYQTYRGKCLELSKKAVEENPSLRLVRGWYYCPIWNVEEQHWWTVDSDGVIYDPSRLQYPSAGGGIYREFTGVIECDECGREVKEEDAVTDGRFAFCSTRCYGSFVGIYI